MKAQALTIEEKVNTRMPTNHGEFRVHLFRSSRDPTKEHLALVYGDVSGGESVLARIHSECFTGEVLGSLRCDCREQLHTAQHLMSQEGRGVIVYLRQEGRGIGLEEKLKAYNLQDQGFDTVEANLQLGHQADARTYDEAGLILKSLGVKTVRLLTNNPDKIKKLQQEGIPIISRLQMVPRNLTPDNLSYLVTKVEKMSHDLNVESLLADLGTPLPSSAASSESSDGSAAPTPSPPSSPSLTSRSLPSLLPAQKKALGQVASKEIERERARAKAMEAAERLSANYFY